MVELYERHAHLASRQPLKPDRRHRALLEVQALSKKLDKSTACVKHLAWSLLRANSAQCKICAVLLRGNMRAFHCRALFYSDIRRSATCSGLGMIVAICIAVRKESGMNMKD